MIRLAAACLALFSAPAGAQEYFPPQGDEVWERISPEAAGFDAEALQAAIDFAIEHETRHADAELEAVSPARDLTVTVPLTWAFEPFSSPVGPLKPRGAPSGVILRGGRIVAEWGEPGRIDMTFSISKTFLSHVVGLAVDDGLIASVDDPVSAYVADERFATAHNAPITWDQMLRQTSGWWGTLFGKPAWADRPGRDDPARDLRRGPPEPGASWEYNDVRVNALALAALHVWKRPLPDVLDERIMTPIGASDGWVWHGYENSFVEIAGVMLQSVSGGGHWGGGMQLSAYDLARLGLLGLHRGRWAQDQLLSEAWFDASLSPTDVAPGYGYMNFFLNTGGVGVEVENASADAFAYLGAGSNVVFIEPERDLVVVVRWIEGRARDDFLSQVVGAIRE